jgi:uncharacterized protein YlxW (UPF0749 family)
MSLSDTARNIALLAKKGRSVELLEQLMKLRDQANALQKENAQLKARIAELERRTEDREGLSFDGTVFWGPKDGPGK